MNDKLLPCPFCGGQAHSFEVARHGVGWVECMSCSCAIFEDDGEQAAINAWNRRESNG